MTRNDLLMAAGCLAACVSLVACEKKFEGRLPRTEYRLTQRGRTALDSYLTHMEALLSPSLIIIGGGVSQKSDKFLPRLTGLQARVVPAALHNDAGIVGAGLAAVHGAVGAARAHAAT